MIIAFEILEGITEKEIQEGKVNPGYKYCGTHMIFDIKLDVKFIRKTRLVDNGQKTNSPFSFTYFSVVSR